MSTYTFLGPGAGVSYDAPGMVILQKKIDLPALIATDYGKLALAASATTPLTSFSGFVQNDILEIFKVPAGFVLTDLGNYISTAEGETGLVTYGNNSTTETQLVVDGAAADPDAYFSDDLATADSRCAGMVALDGTVEGFKDIFVTDGTIDVKFTSNITYDTAIFTVFAQGFLVDRSL